LVILNLTLAYQETHLKGTQGDEKSSDVCCCLELEEMAHFFFGFVFYAENTDQAVMFANKFCQTNPR